MFGSVSKIGFYQFWNTSAESKSCLVDSRKPFGCPAAQAAVRNKKLGFYFRRNALVDHSAEVFLNVHNSFCLQ